MRYENEDEEEIIVNKIWNGRNTDYRIQITCVDDDSGSGFSRASIVIPVHEWRRLQEGLS